MTTPTEPTPPIELTLEERLLIESFRANDKSAIIDLFLRNMNETPDESTDSDGSKSVAVVRYSWALLGQLILHGVLPVLPTDVLSGQEETFGNIAQTASSLGLCFMALGIFENGVNSGRPSMFVTRR